MVWCCAHASLRIDAQQSPSRHQAGRTLCQECGLSSSVMSSLTLKGPFSRKNPSMLEQPCVDVGHSHDTVRRHLHKTK
jgi:hypothetical protein